MKRFLSLVLTLCLIVGLLPTLAIPHAHAAVTSAHIFLFGAYKDIDLDDATTDIPEALYWADDGSNAPKAVTADDNWNYSLTIIDDIPTVTLRNANYQYSKSFVYAKYDGKFKLAYEGINNVFVPYSSSESRYFLSFSASTNGVSSARQVYIVGAENAVLNIDGGDNSASMIGLSNKVYLNISGGTLNIEKTTAGGVNALIGAAYCKTTIENCNLTVKDATSISSKHPTVTMGYSSYGVTINNSNVTIESNAHTGLCAGVYQSNGNGVLYPAAVTITGDSNVKIVTDSNTTSDKAYNGVGIYASKLTVNGGNLEIDAKKQAFYGTSTTTPVLTSYDGEYKMYTEKDAAAVTEYTATPYFRLMEVVPCDHNNTTQTEVLLDEPTCGENGHKQITVFCHDCMEEVGTYEVAIPATGEHEYDAVTGICGVCGDVEIPVEGPTWPEDVVFATAEQMANVVLEKKASAGGAVTAHPGGKITYKIFITNNNAESINVHVEDMIPKGTVLLSGCDDTSGRAAYWVEKDIAPGETRVITYNVKPDYTVAEVRASEFDIILTNNEAKVMDVTIPATEDIWVLETFNTEDIRKLEMAIDAMVTAYLPKLNEIKLLNMIFNVGFTAGPGLGTTDPNAVLEMIFDKAGENLGGSTGSGEDATDTALNLLDRVPPHLYGGTAVPAEKDELFRGARATEVTINDLISGDLLFVKNNGETKLYIVDNSHLVYLGKTEVIRKIDPATILPSLPSSEQFVVVRPSINYNITFGLQEGEYFNDADKNGYTEVEKAIIATAEAYLLRGDRAQYTDDMTGTSLYRWQTSVKQPEYYTVDQYGYTNCAAFTYDANYMTTGYAAKNGNATLNTTANNAAFAKKYWDFETGTSSNAGVVFYAEPMVKDDSGAWVETLDDAGKAAIKEQIISLLRPGDIINIRRTTGSGHAMLYVGNGTIIHSGGGSYSNTSNTETHEATVRFRMVEDLFDPAIYATTSCVYYLASFSLIRPSAMTTKGATEHALNRMNNMQGIIGEKVSSTAMGKTVNCGDEITYTFYVFNTNNEDKVITITDELSQYVTFVSATDNAVVDGSNISWNVTVPADTRVAISYTVKVNDGLPQYTAIDGSKAKINGAYHKCYDTYVANTLTATEQQTVVDAVNKVKGMDLTGLTNVQIAELIYKEAFGIEHIFGGKVTTGRELVGGDTDNNYSTKGVDNMGVFNDTWYWESSNKTSVSWMPNYNTSAAAQMVAPGLYGGQLVYQSSYNKNGRDERSNRYLDMVDGVNRSRYFWEKDLVVGDIFMMGGSSNVYLYIYVGNDTFVNISASGFADYTVSGRFDYAPDTDWKYLAVLRPSFVFEEAHNVVDIPAVDAACGVAGKTAGKECADCGVHLVEPLDVPALDHTEEIIPGKDATCTEPGLTEGKKCTVCGEITVAQEEIAALGHTEEAIPGKDATCTEPGLTAGVKCSVCGEILTAQEEIAALGHTEEAIPGKDATCTEPGLTAGVKCATCGEIFTAQEEIAALGHSYSDSHDTDCDVCGTVRDVPVVTVEGVKVNVDAAGNTLKQLHIFYVGDKTVEDIESWTALTDAAANIAGSPYGAGGFRSYTGEAQINAIVLPETGNYVLRLEYVNAEGETLRMSDAFTVQALAKPSASVFGHKITVNAGEGNTVTKVWAFYVGDVAVADINNWNQLVAAGQQNPGVYGTIGYKTYQGEYLNNIVLTTNGKYVLRVQYTDGTNTKVMSQEVTISAAPAITVENGKVAVDGKGFELLTMSVFYLSDGSVENIGSWNALTAASANIAGSPYGAAGYKIYNGETAINNTQLTTEGNYVLRLRYQDAEAEIYVLTVEAVH